MDPLHIAMAMQVSVIRDSFGFRTNSACFDFEISLDGKFLDRGHIYSRTHTPFVLAHEVTHGTAVPLNRRSLIYEGRARCAEQPLTRAAIRIEEAIADLVAEVITLDNRANLGYRPYPPVKPGTRAAYYVQRKAEEALDYIIRITSEVPEL